MIDLYSASFVLFLTAAALLAVSPGPGLAYVIARTAAGGRSAGIASSLGTALGGLAHVAAAALGLSLLIAESAFWFNLLRYLGAAYLVYLGLRLWLDHGKPAVEPSCRRLGTRRIFWEGVAVEAFNIKTALFFLAFLPQFVDPNGNLLLQFVVLGSILLVLGSIIGLRVWWFNRKLQRHADQQPRQPQQGGVIEGEYHVVKGDKKP